MENRKNKTETNLSNYDIANGTFYVKGTDPELIKVLELARKSNTVIRLFYGDKETGTDWMEVNDVKGYVGRTTGPCQIPILLPRANSHGGCAILVENIVKVTINRTIVWSHPKYNIPQLGMESNKDGTYHVFYHDKHGKKCIQRDHCSQAQAENEMAFLRGKRNHL